MSWSGPCGPRGGNLDGGPATCYREAGESPEVCDCPQCWAQWTSDAKAREDVPEKVKAALARERDAQRRCENPAAS